MASTPSLKASSRVLVTVPTVLAAPADCQGPPPRVAALRVAAEHRTGEADPTRRCQRRRHRTGHLNRHPASFTPPPPLNLKLVVRNPFAGAVGSVSGYLSWRRPSQLWSGSTNQAARAKPRSATPST